MTPLQKDHVLTTPASAKIDLLISDVDGTLVLSDKSLTPATVDAVARLRAAGVRFAVTSGRPPRGMKMLFGPLAIDTPIAGFNGGCFTNPDLSIVAQHLLGPDIARETIAMLEEMGLAAWVFAGEDWLKRDDHSPYQIKEEHTLQFQPVIVRDFEECLPRALKVVGVGDDYELVKRGEAAVRAKFGGRVSAARSQPYYLDVTHPQANKGAVVTTLSSMLGIPTERIAVIGDGLNDILMFEKAGLSIAMGNSDDEVKSAATVTTAGNADNGFAKAVADVILGPA